MQAVILAGGQSSRFYPYNLSHKSLIKIMGKSILEHTLLAIKNSGISDIIIVYRDESLKNIIGDGKEYGIKIKYAKQSQPLGMGDAVLCAKDLIESDFYLLHAHHIDFSEFKSDLENKRKRNKELVLLAKEESNIDRFGVLQVDGDRVLDIVEKPKSGEELSRLRIIGIYLLTKDFLNTLKDTPLEHYHFEKALAAYAKTNDVRVTVTDKESVSLKFPWELLKFKNYLLKNMKSSISKSADISKNATLNGDVYIEDGAQILEGAVIKGPCYIFRQA